MEPGESRSAVDAPTVSILFGRAIENPLTTGDRRSLKKFAQQLSIKLTGERPFHCLVADDKKLRELNRQFLGKDYATDVLSFPAIDSESAGDLAISLQRAQAQAEEFGHSTLDEIRVLMLHGVLHLIGYDHEQDGGEMAREERKWRSVFQLPQTLIQRSRSRPGVKQ